jgi:antitoxin component YwqK of YwqJK toxin-antitoxin module
MKIKFIQSVLKPNKSSWLSNSLRSIQKISALVGLGLFLFGCVSSGTKSASSGDLPDFEMKAPNIRIERFSNTKLIRGEGPVLTDCGGRACSPSELSQLPITKIRNFPKHGEWKEYIQTQIPGGDLRNPKFKNVLDFTGRYENGKRVGVWLRPDPETGRTLTEIPYVDGMRSGIAKSFSSSGALVSETHYSQDKMNGPYYLKSGRDGLMLEEGSYQDGKKTGSWTYYHPGKGTVKQTVQFREDKLNGEEKNYFDDGKTVSSFGVNRDDSRIGVWKIYYPTGNLMAEGSYAPRAEATGDSKFERVGVWKEYYPNGNLFGVGPRKHTRTGEWKFYYNDGKLRYDGIMAGEVMLKQATVFDRTGKKVGEGKFFFSLVGMDEKTGDIKDSYKPDIPFTYFHDNGKKRLEIRSQEDAIEYDSSGKELGRGGADAQGRKNGCWRESGKTVYYMLGTARPNMTANACGGS